MNIDEILDLLDEALEDAWTLPLSGGRRVVDIEKMRELTDDIRLNLPAEVRQAKAIVNDRAEIITTAKKEAASIVKKAEDKARAIVNQDDLTKAAQQKAAEIISQAQMQAREMRQAATEFADNLMKSTEQFLVASMEEVKETRAKLRGRKK
ncbi:ATPase [Bittarella massiliensis (ex Durand et al. 2017)]|uniref:ATPase n=1 Tax=Bittarella massiliensis (ex Durand et al. 2017) TaxID=1720313 RepID=UPI001AA116B5|nr:ATPase [Bittarella massiliensis (ex Durand et al. 2017)]MBO1679418.1 ATPase [Bittarella massiliensis (ex Durand et al. 2017)]